MTSQLWVFWCLKLSDSTWVDQIPRPIQRCGWPGEETVEERRAETRAWCTESYWTGMAVQWAVRNPGFTENVRKVVDVFANIATIVPFGYVSWFLNNIVEEYPPSRIHAGWLVHLLHALHLSPRSKCRSELRWTDFHPCIALHSGCKGLIRMFFHIVSLCSQFYV